MSDKFQDIYRIPSARAEWWDYTQNGVYFITICTAHREHYLGEIVKTIDDGDYPGKMSHVETSRVETLHVETLHATSLPKQKQKQNPNPESLGMKNEFMASISPKKGELGSIIRSYKSAVTQQARQIHADFAWQTRFHEHIIRNKQSFLVIRKYIHNNPATWENDQLNSESTDN